MSCSDERTNGITADRTCRTCNEHLHVACLSMAHISLYGARSSGWDRPRLVFTAIHVERYREVLGIAFHATLLGKTMVASTQTLVCCVLFPLMWL
jgi:hypothetical protein